eukprot:3248655-Amphidinium_carterae.1
MTQRNAPRLIVNRAELNSSHQTTPCTRTTPCSNKSPTTISTSGQPGRVLIKESRKNGGPISDTVWKRTTYTMDIYETMTKIPRRTPPDRCFQNPGRKQEGLSDYSC